MTPRFHPNEEWLAAYGSGQLDALREIFVATHLVYCPLCRRSVECHERAAAAVALAALAQPASTSAESPSNQASLQALLSRLDDPLPAAPALSRQAWTQTVVVGAQQIRVPSTLAQVWPSAVHWQALTAECASAPLLPLRDVSAPLALLDLKAHGNIPRHRHESEEFVLVLSGRLRDTQRSLTYALGDLVAVDETYEHELSNPDGASCLCLQALTGRLILV